MSWDSFGVRAAVCASIVVASIVVAFFSVQSAVAARQPFVRVLWVFACLAALLTAGFFAFLCVFDAVLTLDS